MVHEVQEDHASLLDGVEAAPEVGKVHAIKVREPVPVPEVGWNALGGDGIGELRAGLRSGERVLNAFPDCPLRLSALRGFRRQPIVLGGEVRMDKDLKGPERRQVSHPPTGGEGTMEAFGTRMDPLNAALPLHDELVLEEIREGHVEARLGGAPPEPIQLLEDVVSAHGHRGAAENGLHVAQRPDVDIDARGP